MPWKTLVALALIIVGTALTGCAAKASRFILVPDREGLVGQVTVTNAKGTALLDAANEGVTVKNERSAPSVPAAVSPDTIQSIFGDALAAEPPAPRIVTVYFATGSAELDATASAATDEAAAEVARRGSLDVSVDGHTDTSGDPGVNMRVSLARAQAVRDRLVAAGVPAGVITMRYHGKGNLLVPTADNVDEPRNRRVEIVVR